MFQSMCLFCKQDVDGQNVIWHISMMNHGSLSVSQFHSGSKQKFGTAKIPGGKEQILEQQTHTHS